MFTVAAPGVTIYCSTMLGYSEQEAQRKNVLLGSVVHSVQFGEIELIDQGMIVYSNDGCIDQIIDLDRVAVDKKALYQRFRSVVDYTGKLILPGFIDAHCHAPQYVFSGTGMDLPLLAWLEKYTFPCEAKFGDVTFARNAYEKAIRRHLKCGTTFAAYFATIHNSGGKVLVDVIKRVGQRAFVGKVSMDRNSPDFYIEETVQGCQDAEEFARYVLSLTAVGSAFIAAADANTPLTTSALLAQSRVMAASAPSLARSRSTSFGNLSNAAARNGDGNSNNANGASGSKRPRSVSMGDDEGFSRLPPRTISLSSPDLAAVDAAPVAGDYSPRGVTFAPDANDSNSSSSSSRILNGTSAGSSVSGSSTHDHSTPDGSGVKPSAPVFLGARNRPRAISDMDNYGFEEDEYYESGRFRAPGESGARQSASSNANGGSRRTAPMSGVKAANSTSSRAPNADDVVTTLLNRPFTPRVMPCVTPRFVPTCTPEMLGSLGQLAARYGLPVQSHLSESVNEIAWVKELHPDCFNYAGVYQKYGLLNEHCIMAHCCHSDAAERALLARCGTSVVHCANSNFSLDSGVLNVHGCLEEGIKVGLGTDVAGGYSPSMLDAIRQSIIASKVVLFESRGDLDPDKVIVAVSSNDAVNAAAAAVSATASAKDDAHASSGTTSRESTHTEGAELTDASPHTPHSAVDNPTTSVPLGEVPGTPAGAVVRKARTLSYKEAFHLATVGGAQALGMGDVVGNFLPGKKLDCLIIDPAVPQGPFDCFDGEGPLEWFQKFLFQGDDRNIVAVYVDGRQVI
jgi:cytosine/adenosine deaminase-related metal-dependent hydrolase